jgi:hypothetical protein
MLSTVLLIFCFVLCVSSYAKQRLTALHPNVMVQRSPSHFQTGTFYWAHVSRFILSFAVGPSDPLKFFVIFSYFLLDLPWGSYVLLA